MGGSIPQRVAGGPAEASFSQERLYFMEKLAPGSCVFNMLNGFMIKGEIDREIMGRAIREIVRRHEALRTNLVYSDGKVLQVISPPSNGIMEFLDLSRSTEEEGMAEARRLALGWLQKPYDLSRDMLFKTVLIRIGREKHLLALLSHHSVFDGWSVGIFASELVSIYSSFASGKPSPLPEIPIQYVDYADWQRSRFEGGEFEEEWRYWKGRLGADLPVLELQTDMPRIAKRAHRGDMITLILPGDVKDRLKRLGAKNGCTLYMTLLAAFYAYLYRYSGTHDLVVGCPIAGRGNRDLEGLIGLFINTLPVRAELSGSMTFAELLKKTRKLCIEAYDSQSIPFEKIVERLMPERDLSHSPVYQVLFQLRNYPFAEIPDRAITLEAFEFGWVTAKVDLTIDAMEVEDGIRCELEYSTELFNRDTAERMAKTWMRLLEGVADSFDTEISKLQFMDPEECRRLVIERNRNETDYPRDKCIHRLFEEWAAKAPGATAIKRGNASISYGELNGLANRLSGHLREKGIGVGDLVGVCLERSPEMVIALLAILKAGGTYVPLDPNYPKERMEQIIGGLKSGVVVTGSQYEGRLPQAARTICIDREAGEIQKHPSDNASIYVGSGSSACVIYTSGSLGSPKGVCCSHRGLVRTAVNTNYVDLKPGDTVVHASSPVFDAAAFEVWGALLNGARVLIVERETLLSNDGFAELLRREEATVMFITTALFNLKAHEAPSTFKPLKTLMFGGEVADPTSVRKILASGPPGRLLHMYGPTENSVFSTFHEVVQVAEEATSIPIGGNVSNSSSYILDGDLQPVPVGVKGEIYVSGDGVALGYMNQPGLTRSAFLPNPYEPGRVMYKTGDLGKFLPDGSIEFMGREDLQVKIRGFRVELGEVEAVLASYPSVKAAAVVARGGEGGEEKRLIAYVQPSGRAVGGDELRAFLGKKLPNYMVPRSFIFLESMPFTPTGKIDRRSLPPHTGREGEEDSAHILEDDTESRLAILFGKVLGTGRVGREDDFFELGGHSLLAVRLCSLIEENFKTSLPLATLFRAPTVAMLAKEMKQSHPEDHVPLVPLRASGTRPILFLVHPGGGDIHNYARLVKALGEDQPVYGLRAVGSGKDDRFPKTIEEYAAGYVGEIRKVQSRGPYHIAGWCVGAAIAFEMAQQLLHQGEKVGLLGILNFEAPSRGMWEDRRLTRGALFRETIYLVADLLRYAKKRRAAQSLEIPSRLVRLERLAMRAAGIFSPDEVMVPGENTILPETWKRAILNLAEAIRAYEPPPYDGVVTVFKQEVSPIIPSKDPADGWRRLAGGGIVVFNTKGKLHGDMIEPPEAYATALRLRERIDWHEAKGRRQS